MNSLNQVDELVKEYLLFRGFTNTYRTFENECRVDKDKSYQVDKILDELLGYIFNSDIQRLIEYYRYLDLRFFSRLDSRFQRTVKKFELCLLRHYLVYAIQHKKRDKVIEFFDLYGPDLHGKPEWSQWFALPYVKNPATDPTFETFFSKQWTDNYMISLNNFLATTFQFMPLPSLLSFNMDRVQRKAQQTEIESLKSTIESMKAAAEARENEVAKLKHEVAKTRREMTDGISMIRRRAASMTNELKAGNGGTKTQKAMEKTTTSTGDKLVPGLLSTAATAVVASTPATALDPANAGSGSDIIVVDEEEPYVVVSEEEYSEHASAITHAKFSSEGNLIASCDMDNIVRIWSHKGQSFNPVKINNNSSNILSLEWEARSDRFLFLGTDVGTIRVYNVENKSIVQEFTMDSKYPWVTHLSCSPVEPIFVCAGTGNKLSLTENKIRPSALVAWSMKSMTDIGTFQFDTNEDDNTTVDINTIALNHNGQMLVSGDQNGLMRIFDVRSMKSIMEWKDPSNRPCCVAQFSFDENSIYTVDYTGQLSQWSIHKRGTSLSQQQLAGFPPPASYPAPGGSSGITADLLALSKKSSNNAALPPRPKSNPSTSSRSRLSISSSRSTRLPMIAVDDSVTQSLLSVSPRPQMVAFNAETDFVLCASSSLMNDGTNRLITSSSSSSISSLSSTSENHHNGNSNNSSTQGTIYRVTDGRPALQFGHQPIHQKLTTVDWTSSSNTCLLGSVDGSVKITNLIKV
ncbi:WD40-repeat-containing domain protein [Phascolomyces articulosus]|uniref:WD40-repeat-containing domain protein n=1 Tax=Phascolomyces articulosus TaxID=60185 RepID=A0AAD5JUU1_9FUNG|nr:WD40-repeat-containing domain protein [Phascolomyces articulosus]